MALSVCLFVRAIHLPAYGRYSKVAFCLSVCLSICLAVYLSVYVSVCLYVRISVGISSCLSVCAIHLPAHGEYGKAVLCLSVCLSVCLQRRGMSYQSLVGFRLIHLAPEPVTARSCRRNRTHGCIILISLFGHSV